MLPGTPETPRAKSRIYELTQIPLGERSESDVAELHILNATADEKRIFDIACDTLSKAESFVKSEREKVTQLETEVLPRLNRSYNSAVSSGSRLKDLKNKILEAESSLKFAKKWLEKKNIETNPALKARFAPSEAEESIESARRKRDEAKNLYRNKMQRAFMSRMDLLSLRADGGMKILFSAFEDKFRILQRCSSILPGFVPPVPNPVQVSGFIASIYRDQAKKIRYQKMCGILPRAVAAGKHTFERILKEDKAKAEAAHNRAYAGRKKAFVSSAVRIFKENNPDADFRSAQWQENIKAIEVAATNRFLAEHPKEVFVYAPPQYGVSVETDPVLYAQDIESNIRKIAAETKRKADADIAAGRAVPQVKGGRRLKVVDSKGYAKSKKEKAIEKEKEKVKAAKTEPNDEDVFARGLTAADMM